MLVIGLVYRYYGFRIVKEHVGNMIFNLVFMSIAMIITLIIESGLSKLDKKQTFMAVKLQNEMETIKKISNEYKDMLQTLEEAIVVVNEGKLNFQNDIFKSIIDRAGATENPLGMKIFKIFRETEPDHKKVAEQHRLFKNNTEDQLICLEELMGQPATYFRDKVFKIQGKSSE